MKRDILLVSKDALKADYLSCYGGNKWKTPTIDSLAKSGTIFRNYYTAAPSSAMAYTSMFAGLNPYELKRKIFAEVQPFDQCPTLFDILHSEGYENHVIWDMAWFTGAFRFSKVYGQNTSFENLDIQTRVGPHFIGSEKNRAQKNARPITEIIDAVRKILSNRQKPIFLWVHCPHVFAGRTGYGSDIDLFDELVGKLLDFFPCDSTYLTADHGHMDFTKGIPVYGYHLYEPAIKIPLITPNHFGMKEIDDITSNIQLKNIIFEHKIYPQEFIYSDTQYYLQEDRRLMVRKSDFKYIYSKRDRLEELYDLKYDPNENVNLLVENNYDRNRDKNYYLEEVHYYPRWEEAEKAYNDLKNEKARIWKEETSVREHALALLYRLNAIRKKGIANFYRYSAMKKNATGRWNSKVGKVYYDK